MLSDDDLIQLDFHPRLQGKQIGFDAESLTYQRGHDAVVVKFPTTLVASNEYQIALYYPGNRPDAR